MNPARFASLTVAATLGLATCAAASNPSIAQFRYEHGQPLNDLRVTPGAVLPAQAVVICRPGYASSVRNVTAATKARIYAAYGITHHVSGAYEIDHLISLELGGSNAAANLWPERNDHPRGYLNSKDILENRLHALVCAHELSLTTAQRAIATDWVGAYHRYLDAWPGSVPASVGKPTPTAAPLPVAPTASVRITSLSPTVHAGSTAALAASSSRAGDRCTLEVDLPSGRTSTARGLGTATASATGALSWSWSIGPTTDPGTARAIVRCGSGSASATFTIT